MCSRRGHRREAKEQDRSNNSQRMAMTKQSDDESGASRSKVPRASKLREAESRHSTGRIYVDHTYHDHLHDPKSSSDPNSLLDGGSECRKKGPRGGVTITFPEKLHIMLQACSDEGLEDIVSWLPHGRCFLVHQKTEFVEQIMPRFFHQSKMTSFQRQLNLYGFVRLTAGKDRGAYYHELFLRSRPDLCQNMARTRVKGNGMKAASSPQTEPNFYSMEPSLEGSSRRDGVVRSVGIVTSSSCSTDESMPDQELDRPPLCVSLPGAMPAMTLKSLLQKIPSSASIDPPAIVSLPSTPQQLESKTLFVDWPENIFFSTATTAMELFDTWSDDELEIPASGDEVFFEGSKFHYLDREDIGLTEV